MGFPNRLPLPLAVLSGVVVAVLTFGFLQIAWKRAGEYDANPKRATVKNQLMRHKAEAMDDVLELVIAGRLADVSDAAGRVKDCSDAINGYLSTDVYQKYGEDFYAAIEDLRKAADAGDRGATKEAILRLERSCIECHFLIDQPDSVTQVSE